VRPDHALITRIAPAHLEGMGSVDAIADEKADIFAGLETNGTIALPSDDAFRERLAARARMHCPSGELACFGTDPEASARLTACETDGVSTHAEISLDGQKVRVRLAAVGQHWAMNATAALLLAVRTGLAPGDAAAALEGFTPPSGRGTAETLHLPGGGTAMLIDDAYNANPESMRAALAALAARPANRHLAALGEMLEMGEASAAGHSGLSGPVSAAGLDTVFLAGGEMAALGEALDSTIRQHRATTAADLEETVKNTLADGDVLLIKGSNASGMAKLADRLRQWSEASRPADVMERRPEGAARGDDAV